MRLLKETLGVLGALVVLAVIVAFVAPNRARAVAATLVQIVPGNTTHVGQAESRLVSLRCFIGKAYCSEIGAEGNVDESTAYVVPKGYTLIVTDYQWQSNAPGPGLLSDDLFNLKVGQFNAGEAQGFQNGSIYSAYGHEHYVTGFRVGSGVTLTDANAQSSSGASLVQATWFRTTSASAARRRLATAPTKRKRVNFRQLFPGESQLRRYEIWRDARS
jgi:hypothetical protein